MAIGEGEGWYGEEKIEDGIPLEVFTDTNQLYIGIRIEGHQEMYPRSKILSVGYAYKAKRADEADIAEKAKTADEAERSKMSDLAEKAKTAENVMGSVSITPTGDVTINPTEKLEVTGKVAAVSFEGNGSNLRGIYSLDTPDGKITNAVYVDSNGNVGIGTQSPQAKFEVAGNIYAQGEVKSQVNGTEFFMVPKGAIIMWSGVIDSIPDGWALCDGTNGTPDLRERFVMGAASGDNPGASGGASSYSLTVDQLPSHTHTGSTSLDGNHSHNGNTNTTGSHSHKYRQGNGSAEWIMHNSTMDWIYSRTWYDLDTSNSGSHSHSLNINSNGNHSHSFTTNFTGSDAPIDNRPNYYALAFIMKI